ncbi:MAG: hypothetical protein ACOYKE_09495 [Ferruginibacter sp.]
MNNNHIHSFHIPVMGLAFTIDTPLKVARFGISSVVSIIDDVLLEAMRKFHVEAKQIPYSPIDVHTPDCRANRITAYLNFLNDEVEAQIGVLKKEAFENGSEKNKYFELLPAHAPLKIAFNEMMQMPEGVEKIKAQAILTEKIVAGSIDVNIMTKIDKTNYAPNGDAMAVEYTDAMAALRGYANSHLKSSIVFSAGMNPRLYSYCENFNDFFPDENGQIKKKIILKVSDFRSAQIQGKFLAKKGLLVSEFRIESGLNCGGHAFATDGYLLGPILESFKQNKQELEIELFNICNAALSLKAKPIYVQNPVIEISVQGGIGTANENQFLLEYYKVNSTGWGSPFLLVPEATNVDEQTLQQLVHAQPSDYYCSNASPLGVRFNNLKKTSEDQLRIDRIEKDKPGSPCYNKYLSNNTEFTTKPICTASREYQYLKIEQLKSSNLSEEDLKANIEKVTEKECLCQGLSSSAYLTNHLPAPHQLNAVTICPGPNLAYFSNTFSLRSMIDHIYGRKDILNPLPRPNFFINELNLYVDYLKKEINTNLDNISAKQSKYLSLFKDNLQSGINYYKEITATMIKETENYRQKFNEALHEFEANLTALKIPEPAC